MKQISAFDLDHTLVRSNSSLLFYRHMISRGFYRPISLIGTMFYSMRHYFLNLGLDELHHKIFERFLKGAPLQFVQAEVAKFLKKDFYRSLYLPTFNRLRLAQHEGHYTVILSNGPSFIVGPIAEYLGVDEWHSSEYSVDKRGNFSEIESILLGGGKAACIEKLIQRLNTSTAKVTAYSDSDLDLPFLESVGNPVAVNPNAKLLKVSREHSWEIL
jgi:HAD superfamily hydrolase (TIGR01490 family)